MNEIWIQSKIEEIVAKKDCSSGDNLDGFIYDIDNILGAESFFCSFDVKVTTNKKCLLVCRGKLNNPEESKAYLSNRIIQIWKNELIYDEELSFIQETVENNNLNFYFVTASVKNFLCVTGKIIVEK